MEALLERLAKHPEALWLACIAWAALWALLPDGFQLLAWPVGASVAVVAGIIAFDHLYRYAPLRDALKLAGQASVPSSANKLLAGLMFASTAMMVAALWVFELNSPPILPLMLSVFLPHALKRRGEEVEFMVARRTVG